SDEGIEVLATGNGDRNVSEAEARRPRSCATAVPGVHGDVMVVSAGRSEEDTGHRRQRGLEPECVDVEFAGLLDVADLQVDVADDAGLSDSVREDVLIEVAFEETVRVEVERVHLDLTVERVRPFRTGAVDVEFDAVAFGI